MPEKETIERAREDAREGKIAQHAGGRIRTRGDAPYTRRQAWRGLSPTGHCDRPVQGPACRSEVAGSAWEGIGANPPASQPRL